MRTTKQIVLALLGVLMFSGCVSEKSGPDERRAESDLVFNDFNVEQIREQHWDASGAALGSPVDLDAARRSFQMARAANSAALVRAPKLDPENGCSTGLESNGSGTLTSSTRITTAHHVVYPYHVLGELRASFGGQCEASAQNCSGNMVKVRSNLPDTAENPLLASRLFALGLHEWALKTGPTGTNTGFDARKELREDWEFDVVDTSQQPYMPSAANGWTGQDAVVLEFFDKDGVPSFGPLDAGQFDINRPGLFFGSVLTQEYDATLPTGLPSELTCTGTTGTCPDRAPVWGAHFPALDAYGSVPPGGDFMPVVSNPGFRKADVPAPTCANNPDDGCDGLGGSVVDYTYEGCVDTTLDARSGSSGGGVFMSTTPSYTERDAPNILSQQGVFQGVDPNRSGWDLSLAIDAEPEVPTSDARTMFTAMNDTIENIADEDTPSYIRGLELVCPAEDESGKCVWSEFREESQIGVGADPELGPDQTTIVPEGSPADDAGATYQGWMRCSKSQPSMVAAGILGAATNPRDDEATRIGSLMMVCAPRSCASWSDNWPHLKVQDYGYTGKFIDLDGDNEREQIFQDMLLRTTNSRVDFQQWLREAMELRVVAEGDGQVRPPSYKLCPPNHLLNGVEVLRDEETSELAGITDTRCQPVNERASNETTWDVWGALISQTLWVDDDPAFGTWDWEGFPDSDEQYSISARIGHSDANYAGNAEHRWLGCDQGEVVWGLRWTRNKVGHLIGLELECVEAPRPKQNPSAEEACRLE